MRFNICQANPNNVRNLMKTSRQTRQHSSSLYLAYNIIVICMETSVNVDESSICLLDTRSVYELHPLSSHRCSSKEAVHFRLTYRSSRGGQTCIGQQEAGCCSREHYTHSWHALSCQSQVSLNLTHPVYFPYTAVYLFSVNYYASSINPRRLATHFIFLYQHSSNIQQTVLSVCGRFYGNYHIHVSQK